MRGRPVGSLDGLVGHDRMARRRRCDGRASTGGRDETGARRTQSRVEAIRCGQEGGGWSEKRGAREEDGKGLICRMRGQALVAAACVCEGAGRCWSRRQGGEEGCRGRYRVHARAAHTARPVPNRRTRRRDVASDQGQRGGPIAAPNAEGRARMARNPIPRWARRLRISTRQPDSRLLRRVPRVTSTARPTTTARPAVLIAESSPLLYLAIHPLGRLLARCRSGPKAVRVRPG